jgi:acyl-CoA thioesterase
VTIEPILASLELEPVGTDRYRAGNASLGHHVVFGGQLLAQSIVAGLAGHDGKTVKTLHTVFARGASYDAPVEITVDRMHEGRAFASSSVTIAQGDRLCTRSLVLLTADEPDLIRHADPAPSVPGPDDCPPGSGESEGFLIGTAMRPHPGVGQAQAHVTLSTGVIGHTLTFHEPVDAGDWLLLSQRSPYAGRGRSYGRADVFDTSGALVASFVQDDMIRAKSGGPGAL